MADPPRRLEPPQHYDQARRDTWAQAVTDLAGEGGIFRADPHTLDAYVEAVATHAQASQLLAQTNVLITRGDRALPNPAVAIQRQAADQITRTARALGLHRTPLAVSVAPGRPDPLGGARWCEQHQRAECVHHRRRCAHQGGPVPAEGCCHQQAVKGTPSCYHHAGKPLAAARADGQAVLARIYSGLPLAIDPAAALLAELGFSARLTSELRARVAELAEQPGPDGRPGSGLFWGTVLERERDGVVEREHRAGPHAILKALNDEAEHLVRTAAAARATGAMETQAEAARRMAAHLTRLLDVIFAGLELSPRQRDELIPVVVPAAIRAWELESAPGGA
jgi:P27 family predicted phage terminase small subunit